VAAAVPTILLCWVDRRRTPAVHVSSSRHLLKWVGLVVCLLLCVEDTVNGSWRRRPELLIFFTVTGVLTLMMFAADRRRPLPGHWQKCGYDLTGNVSGRCPECGEPVNQGSGKA